MMKPELTKTCTESEPNQATNTADTGPMSRPEETVVETPSAVKDFSATLPIEDSIEVSSLRYPIPELTAGRMFGRYRIERELGRGGMGAVYRAYDSHLHRPVALKVPFFKKGHSAEIVKRFLREARAVARLSHANLCRVFDVGVIDGTLFLTMEFVEGQSLEQISKSGEPMPAADVVPLIRQVALALQEAHDCGIIHRDMKPANIMLNAKGQPVLMDFGLAREVEREENDLTKDGAMLGTPAYMSPEQIRGIAREIGPATDIYSLGVVMYRLLTGRRPFEGTFTAILSAIPTETPISPSDLCGTVSPAIEAICLKAIAKKPSDRFASALKFAEALDSVCQVALTDSSNLEDRASALSADAAGQRSVDGVSQQSAHKKLLVRVLAAVCLLVVVAGIVRFAQSHPKVSPQATEIAGSTAPLTRSESTPSPQLSETRITSSKIVQPVVAAEARLEVHLQRAKQQTGFTVLSNKSLPLTAKDKLQLHVNLSGPAYVYVFWVDTEGLCKVFWPVEGDADAPQSWRLMEPERQQPVGEVWLPALAADKNHKQKMFSLDESTGLETILVATSLKPLGPSELKSIESVRVDLAHFDPSKQELVSFRSSSWKQSQPAYATLLVPAASRGNLVALLNDRERGVAGVVETIKAASLSVDDYTKRFGEVFDSYTGLVFPHE